MKITIELIDKKERGLLKSMLYDYQKEMLGGEPDEYKYLDSYWEKKDRFPYFIKVDGKVAGFVLVNEYNLVIADGKNIAEFYVLKEFRKNGVGKEVAKQVYNRFPGKWENRQMVENPYAHSYWQRLIADFTNNDFEEIEMNNDKWQGWIQTFDMKGKTF